MYIVGHSRVLLIYSANLNDISPPREIPAGVFRRANRVYPRNVCTRFETRWNQPPDSALRVRVCSCVCARITPALGWKSGSLSSFIIRWDFSSAKREGSESIVELPIGHGRIPHLSDRGLPKDHQPVD